MKIKNILLKNKFILAPMADYTDVAFRKLCKLGGAALSVTEMVSAKGLIYENKKTLELLQTFEGESPVSVQLFGSEPEVFAKACQHEALKKFDIIDLNMGCPATKIVTSGEGCALMKDLNLAKQIIVTCVQKTDKPITVKFRSGWSKDSINAVEFAKMCQEAGASAITIHGRTREQLYGGKVDYEQIRLVKQAVNIPVIGSGDIVDKASLNAMLDTGVDMVMIGRAAIGNPYIFSQLQGIQVQKNKLEIIKKQIAYLKEFGRPQKYIVLSMRKHLAQYLAGEKNSSTLKKQMFAIEDLAQLIKFLESVFT